jgi:hypothetical protein
MYFAPGASNGTIAVENVSDGPELATGQPPRIVRQRSGGILLFGTDKTM